MTSLRRYRARQPVYDPRPGILSDWFGVDAGGARVLFALYQAKGPVSREELSKRAAIGLATVRPCLARLRAAGVDIPDGRAFPLYALPDEVREDVRHAFGWIVGQLHELEPECARFGLTRTEWALFQSLSRRAMANYDQMMAVLDNGATEAPSLKLLNVHVCKMRKKLALHGLAVHNIWGVGYRLDRLKAA
jgi:hypothetical protein